MENREPKEAGGGKTCTGVTPRGAPRTQQIIGKRSKPTPEGLKKEKWLFGPGSRTRGDTLWDT